MKIPEHAGQILKVLNQNGFEAYVVGGCVRDALLDRPAGDWDITTSASPRQVKALFAHTIDTGIAHGTVTVMLEGEGYEVTTYRIDGAYLDGRHPSFVTFTACLEEDLKRRDFTINAMAYHPQTGLVDLFDGQADLKKRRIRCVGDPKERFTEDALRMMRALRFSAQLDFTIEADTAAAIAELAPRLSMVSAERIQAELVKLLVSGHPGRLAKLYELGLGKYVLEELCSLSGQETERVCAAAALTAPKKHLRLAALFGYYPGRAKEAENALKRLRFDNDTIRRTELLVRYAGVPFCCQKPAVRKLMSVMGAERFSDLLALREAWVRAGIPDTKPKERQEALELIDRVRGLAGEILASGDCLTVRDLAVDGTFLRKAGIKPGPAIGELLSRMLEYVLEHPECNTIALLSEQFPEIADRD